MCYAVIVFAINPCAAGCGRPAITGNNLCYLHLADSESETARICKLIKSKKEIKDLNASGLFFDSVDFSGHHFYGCNFKEAVFFKCNLSGIKSRMSFFDFAEFKNCDISKSDIQFLSLAGTTINGCSFEGSEIVHINFEGALIVNTTFDNSNLYNSRFISAELEKVRFVNCNLKRVYFASAKHNDVLFKSSNTAEALFEMEEN